MRVAIYLSMAIVLSLYSCCKQVDNKPTIIPQPKELKFGQYSFKLDQNTVIAYQNNKKLKDQSVYFSDLLQNTFGLRLKTQLLDEAPGTNAIVIRLADTNEELGVEGYVLIVKEGGVIIRAKTERGTFYGLQSLYQLLLTGDRIETGSEKSIVIPTVDIVDEPRFRYRGMHLDVARHMFPVEFIKKYIDLLALYKFNTFHWHLTEDQGWRIEIKKYPELTEIGSMRKETLIGHGGKKPFKYDGKPYGGYYTQDEVRDIVEYADQRQITIIPEIEMPGHSLAVLASYPELACTAGPFEVATRWGVFEDIYCTKEETFEFLENVLLEVMDMFPSKYIHIGGDEAPKARWKECLNCQDVIKRENLQDEHELQSYFIQRMEKFLNSHGRSIIGWDEILEGGLAPNATVMSWRGTEGGIAAAKQGHDAIMTPGTHCYFDHYQVKSDNEPLAIGGFTSLEKLYFYNPVPDTLNQDEAKHILGAQGNVWTEYIDTPEHVEYMVIPRIAALSEVNWSDEKDWEQFKKKMDYHFRIYDDLGYNYCDHPFDNENTNK
jgi:hexosaminidase